MADISIYFHALPQEQRDFVKECASDFSLHVVAIEYFPYTAVEISSAALPEVFAEGSPIREIALMLHHPNLPAKSNMDFWDKNPNVLRLQIGKRTKDGMQESHLSARTEDPAVISVWKKVAKRLQTRTAKGALAVQPKTGATGAARGHRYTLGAKVLESSGVPMLTITGIIMKLGETTDLGSAKQ